MAKKSNSSTNQAALTDQQSPEARTEEAPAPRVIERTPVPEPRPQGDLLAVANRLQEASLEFRRREEEYSRVRGAYDDLQQVMGTVLRSVNALAERTESPAARAPVVAHLEKCEPCQCVASECCCFDFIFRRVRVTAGQVGVDAVADGEVTTGLASGRSGMECQLFVSIDGSGIIVPNQIWGFIQLLKRLNRPGVWYEIDRKVNSICVPRGCPRTIPFTVQVVEREIGTTEVPLGLDEFGSTTREVTLDCNCPKITLAPVQIPLESGGAGGGEVEAMFEAIRVCA